MFLESPPGISSFTVHQHSMWPDCRSLSGSRGCQITQLCQLPFSKYVVLYYTFTVLRMQNAGEGVESVWKRRGCDDGECRGREGGERV